MEPTYPPQRPPRKVYRDTMNNEISSTSSEDAPSTAPVTKLTKRYNPNYNETYSDNESNTRNITSNKLQNRNHRSMVNISDNNYIMETNFDTSLQRVQNSISNIDLSLHSDQLKKLESLQVPIVGYEVMEERARFTIYKLKVQDDKTGHCWLVFRRFTDFVRLYSRIRAEQPNILLPLPSKRWFRDNFDPSFLDERVKALQVFINAILKKLPNNPLVRDFFCFDEPPQVFSYQPEVQAVYGALEDSISSLKGHIKQKDATILQLQKRIDDLEAQVASCQSCSTKSFSS